MRAYTSRAQLPLQDVALTLTAADGTTVAMRLTDRSGQIDPIEFTVPDLSESQVPDPGQPPFLTLSLRARLQNYEQIQVDGIQVFADTHTLQDLEMIPLAQLPDSRNKTEVFRIPAQNL